MRITLDIPDGIICAVFTGVECTETGLQFVSYQLSSDDFMDGNTVKLPCVCCGAPVPEGRQVCWSCEHGYQLPDATKLIEE